jgi:hypothetical protein
VLPPRRAITRLDPAPPQLASVLVVVVAAVGDEPVRTFSGPTALAAHRADAVDQREQLGDVVAVATGERGRERTPSDVNSTEDSPEPSSPF